MVRYVPLYLVLLAGCPEGTKTSGDTAVGGAPRDCRQNPELVRTLEEDRGGALSFLIEFREGYKALERLGTTPGQLLAIARNSACSTRARFAAFEAWLYRVRSVRVRDLDEPTAQAMLEVYAAAFEMAPYREGRIWGSPLNVRSSRAVNHMLSFGRRVIPYLRPYFDDTRSHKAVGSEGATYHNDHEFRVCDLAAAIVAEALDKPELFPTEGTSPKERQVALRKLIRYLDTMEP